MTNTARLTLPEPIGATYTISGIQHCTLTRNEPNTDLFTKEQLLACIAADRAERSVVDHKLQTNGVVNQKSANINNESDALGFAVMEHIGPAALTGGTMSILEAFKLGWKARTQSGSSPAVAEWQPIETAPKDGASIIVYARQSNTPIDIACWSVSAWYHARCVDGLDMDYQPTHWTPLPAPPSPTKEQL